MLMKLSKLLATRQGILRQARLANLAYAYTTLKRLADRIANARLSGAVRLQPADPTEERYWATLTALEGNQSVIEEQFSDQDILDLADATVFAIGGEFAAIEFPLENLREQFVAPIRELLDEAGVIVDEKAVRPEIAAENAE
jgi:hypothetical protein